MRTFCLMLAATAALLATLLPAPRILAGEMLEGLPLGYAGGCSLDLDRDGERDMAMLLTAGQGREAVTSLVVLLARGDGYEARVPARDAGAVLLTCHYGDTVTESGVAAEEGREPDIHEINGPYLRLTLPESFSAVYYWREEAFVEVVTAD